MSPEESEEPLTYDEVNCWRCDALKLYCRQRCLKVSGSKQELVGRVFAASEMGISVQPTAEERIATSACERESSIVRIGKWIFFGRSFHFERLASWE